MDKYFDIYVKFFDMKPAWAGFTLYMATTMVVLGLVFLVLAYFLARWPTLTSYVLVLGAVGFIAYAVYSVVTYTP